MTNEFKHYDGCGYNDPDNCSACALTDLRQDRPNYSAWPLAYMENHRTVPAKWKAAFVSEMMQTSNIPYAENVKKHVHAMGVRFSDGTKYHSADVLIEMQRKMARMTRAEFAKHCFDLQRDN